MNRVFSIGWAIATTLFLAAACSTLGGSLSSSAERLEHTTHALTRHASDAQVALRRDSVALAHDSKQLRVVLANSNADRSDVRDAFSDVSQSYLRLREEVERSNDPVARRDFGPVTVAYLDMEREVSRIPELRDRYAALD